MCFIQRHVLDIFFSYDRADSELNLRTRRPDLWTLPLTCENTKKTVPYLEIVNEILERYIATKQGHTPLNDPTADRAAVEGVVYRQTLAQGRDSFVQPFSLPHATVREYLSAFTDERSQADVARALGLGDDRVSAAEWKLSQAELSLITQTAIGLGTLRKLYNVGFSVEAASGLVKPFDAQLLLPATRLSRADLETVLDTRFVSADGTEHAHITPEKFDSNSVQNDIERIHGLRLSSLDRLHRFTRLWRRTDWSVIELDLLLEHLEKATLATGIGSTAVNTLVFIRQLQQRFGISAEACCALFSELPTRPLSAEPSFFDRLFNLPDFVLADGALPNNAAFIHPALRVAPTAATDSKLQRVPAGLRVSDEQLYQLIGALAAPLGVDLNTSNETDRGFVLNIANLTLLYRHARLAEWLDLDIPSLFQLIRLTPALGSGYVGDLDTIEALLARIDWWRSTAVTLDDLAWATGGDVRFPDAYPAPVDLAGAMIQGMLDERALHFANTVFAFSENITEAQSRDIVAANAARVSTAPDGSYTLADDYDPGVALTIPASAAGVDEASLRSVLSFYYATEIIPGRLSGALGFTPDKLAAILRLSGADLLDTSLMAALKGMDPGNPDDALVDLIRDVQPLATVLADVLFDVDSVDFLRANPGLVGVSNWNALTLTQLQSVFAFGELKRRALAPKHGSQLPLSTGEFHTLLSGFTATGGYANADGDVLARLLDAELGLVLPVLETVTVSGGALTHLGTLSWCVAIAQHLGVGGDALPLIASSDFDELRQASDKLLSALRASFDIESDFTRTIEPHNDVIRTQKRVALVDYLLRSDDFDFENERHLYHHFLLDVETGGCARTTPLAAAISSAQLYVHRCVMNLEQDARAAGDTNKIHVFPGAIPRAEWAWRKSYRTWEANRKIFLWPENYLEPTLRDNKTSLFEELESDLLQQPITEQTARDAYARYLRGFDEIATLRIAGSYHHKDARNRTDVLPPDFRFRCGTVIHRISSRALIARVPTQERRDGG